MLSANLTIDRERQIGSIDPRLFGSFIEHLGHAVYDGIYEPDHPTANEHGFRQDVLDLVRELRVPIVRYPGGNFVSGYRWEDGVGPIDQRPARLDLAWRSTEPNTIGTNEFARWCELAETELMLAVNLGTRGMEEALDLLEYCNHPSGTALSDLRRQHGIEEPHDVRVWCLGNEMDGPWQVGQKTPVEYGRLAAETAKAMKRYDPSLELVLAGSSNTVLPTYPDWDATALDLAYDHVDYISLHNYYVLEDGDLDSFLAQSLSMEEQIRTIVAICDQTKARRRSKKQVDLSFDEWNAWYHTRWQDKDTIRDQNWPVAPPLAEDTYTMADAVLVGSLLISLLKHVDRVRMACLAQLVNVIAPIMTKTGGGLWKQTTYFPYKDVATTARGTALDVLVDSPAYEAREFDAVPVIDATATSDEESGSANIFLVNRSRTEDVRVSIEIRGMEEFRSVEYTVLTHEDPHAVNTAERPDIVAPVTRMLDNGLDGGALEITVPKLSWNSLRFGQASSPA